MMRRRHRATDHAAVALAAAIVLTVLASPAWAQAPRTMRIDYSHSGTDREEQFALDRVVVEPLPWPGNPARPVDRTNLGKYFFEVLETGSGRVLYSRGFSSIYGEWETTAEARTTRRTFSESLRFPAPGGPVRIVLRKRDAANAFREVWTLDVDPADPAVERASRRTDAGDVIAINNAGDPASKLDVLFIGDGYTADERDKFERDARRLAGVLFATAPFRDRRADINVWGLAPVSPESGITHPERGPRRSALGSEFGALGLARYVLTYNNRALRELAASAPYEVVQIVANSDAYGGGGIFNLYSVVAVDSPSAAYLFVHEFGHQIAGLADEYFEGEVSYLPPAERVEPWEPNVTALLDGDRLKWAEHVAPGTPIPTPWSRAGPPGSSDREVGGGRAARAAMSSPFAGRVGAFEGANYQDTGFFRPELDCVMFSGTRSAFCLVCRHSIEEIVDLYSRF